MALSYFQPIEAEIAFQDFLPQTIGGSIQKHTSENGFPNLENVQIAIFALEDEHNFTSNLFRNYFYKLYKGNWQISIADLGNLPQTQNPEDTFFMVRSVIETLVKQNVTPVFLGQNQELTYPIYQAFYSLEQLVNLVCVDPIFDFGNQQEFVSVDSYLSRILTEENTILNHYTNIGYQTYYNPQEVLDIVEKMYFDAYRLGEISSYLEGIEPILRDADIVSLDMRSVQASDIDVKDGFPNGFTNREICTIARYAGLSMRTAVFGIFHIADTPRSLQLVSQILWYFIEGYNYRVKEFPTISDVNFLKYNVLINELNIQFYKSKITGRWWILPNEYTEGVSMLPCTEKDYSQALQGIIPERWWKLYKKQLG